MLYPRDRFLRRLPIPVLTLLTLAFVTGCTVRLFAPSLVDNPHQGGLFWKSPLFGQKPRPAHRQGEDIDLSDPEAPFVSWPLARVCDETTWVDGLVFLCDNNSGGPGNIRNYIQTCLRYAIEAGATGLVIPTIRKRSDNNIADLFTDALPFNYMFDEDHFRHAFTTACPQITLYAAESNIPSLTPATEVDRIRPQQFGYRGDGNGIDQDRHTDRFGVRFRRWLQDGIMPGSDNRQIMPATSNPRAPPSSTNPRLIRFEWGAIWLWPVYRDGPEFASTFGSVLKFNEQLLDLGKKALSQMRTLSHQLGGSGTFLGAHLRTEADALDFWPRYRQQADAYLQRAGPRGFRTAYLATGNETEATRFAQEALSSVNMKVHTKEQLLFGKDLEDLLALSWDQKAIVDALILLGSDYFVGVMPSSFSVYVAMKRHLRIDGLYMRPYRVGTEGDGLSYLVGSYQKYWDEWLFMFDGMWP